MYRFEAENAVEDADNLFSQTQALIDERQCLLSNVADAQSEISALKRGLAEQSKTEEEMTALKSKYEDLKVVYDKLKAESSSAAAALESEFSMTLSTVKSLERKVRRRKPYVLHTLSSNKNRLCVLRRIWNVREKT